VILTNSSQLSLELTQGSIREILNAYFENEDGILYYSDITLDDISQKIRVYLEEKSKGGLARLF